MQSEERADILSTTADSVVEGELVEEGVAEAIQRLRARGMTKKAIARELRLDIKTVRKWLRTEWKPQRREGREQALAKDDEWIRKRFPEVGYSAKVLHQELGDLATAALRFREALAVYEHLGMTIERLRTEWLLALMSLRSGHEADGQRRLQQVSAEFVSHGNAAEGALVLIDLAEDMVMRGARSEAVAVLRAIDRATVGPFVASQLDVLEQVSRDGELIHQLRDLRAMIETSPP